MTPEQLQQMQQMLQKSLIRIKTLEAELQQKENIPAQLKKEPVAIIGCGVRLPGNITTTEKLWKLLEERRSLVKKIPAERFDVDSIYDADGNTAGKTNSRFGTFLENDIRAFDASFFGVSPREAKCIDPLQRMVLEVVYEAFENAGIPTDKLKGSKTGVYIALGNSDYISARFRNGNLDSVDLYDTTGILFGTAGGRVSYLYDFVGPSYNVDAACASTVLALQLAKEDLQKNIIDLAVVTSANLLLTPEMFVGLSKLGSLSSTNECRAFANDCDGYIRGEGCGVALLKRLSDAERDNDNIELIIKGSSVKHNGKSNGFTAPNPEIITNTITEALQESGLTVHDIDYVEAHGIGNRFTDAVEVQSIHEGYKGRTNPIYVGSVKANVGHLEAGTGMPMLFKVIEVIRNKKIPAQINVSSLNEDVEWNKIKSTIALEEVVWTKENGQPLRAAINLSGYSGTNAHMIFEAPAQKSKSDDIAGPYHFILSAKDEEGLKNTARKYVDDPSVFQKYSLSEICYTLQTGRNHFDHTLAITGKDKEDILRGLNAYLQSEKEGSYILSNPQPGSNKEVAFLFTGQGAQYSGMCIEYYQNFELFRNVVDECDRILQPFLKASIKDILWSDADKNLINQTKYTQPALFVVEYALAQLWMSYGITPAALIGHSIGEIAALAIANAITLEDALKLVTARGALMNSLPENTGSMASVFCSESELKPLLENSNVDLAAINSIKNCTVSGKKDDIVIFVEKLKEQGIKAVLLNVSHAFHSHLMEPILEKFKTFTSQVAFRQPEIPVISNLTGKEITHEDLNANYFSEHIRKAVQYSKGIKYLHDEMQITNYLEVGPNPVLINLSKQTITDEHATWMTSAKKDTSDSAEFYNTLLQLYSAGQPVSWNNFYIGKKINRVQLHPYGWNWKIYWEDPVLQHRSIVQSPNSKVDSSNKKPVSSDNNHRQSTTDNGIAKKATRETLLAYLQIEAAKVLGLEAGQKLDIYKTYRAQGFDSMMSGEFLTLMEKHVGSELKMEVLHQYNTPKDLHQYLIDTYYGGGEIDTTQAITLADIMFSQEMENSYNGDWHEIRPEDNAVLRWFKKLDKYVPSVK